MVDTTPAQPAEQKERLPLPPRIARFVVLFAVFVCAACGLVYELALVALGSYLLGDTITQASVVLAVMVFAMGVGSLASKQLTHRPAFWFAVVEGLLSLLGGLSVLILYAAFAWFSLYQPALVSLSFLIGVLIGAEIPLLMTLIQRIRRQEAASAVADLFAADYVGGLIGGLAFPFLLAAGLRTLVASLLVGILNAVTGIAIVLVAVPARDLTRGGRIGLPRRSPWSAVLGGASPCPSAFDDARQADVRATQSCSPNAPIPGIVLTATRPRRLSAVPQRRSPVLVRGRVPLPRGARAPGDEPAAPPKRVLVLGGGDGLALREVLAYPDVGTVTSSISTRRVDRLAPHPRITALNRRCVRDHASPSPPTTRSSGSDHHRAVRRDRRGPPRPRASTPPNCIRWSSTGWSARYGPGRSAGRRPRPGLRTSPPAHLLECRTETVRGSRTAPPPPYHVDVPSFGDWGFFLAATDRAPHSPSPTTCPTPTSSTRQSCTPPKSSPKTGGLGRRANPSRRPC